MRRENNAQSLRLVPRGQRLPQYQNRDWVEVSARVALGQHPAYQGEGPILDILSIAPCEKPTQDVVTF